MKEYLYFLIGISVLGFLLQLFEPRDIFAGEKLVSDIPFKPKKQYEDHYSSFEKWFLGIGSPEEERRRRKLWMDKHYGGGTHPIDL